MIKVPKQKEFLKRIKAFEKHELRHPIYKISSNSLKKRDRPILKLIDEYNYAKYTKDW